MVLLNNLKRLKMENNQTEHLPEVGKKMSSIDWLIRQMSLEDVCKYSNKLAEAKEMRIQELKDAFYGNDLTIGHGSKYENFEHYYRETYGKEKTNVLHTGMGWTPYYL